MKLNPPASSSDLDVARQIARRLHQQRRRADQPAWGPEDAPSRARLTPPPLPQRTAPELPPPAAAPPPRVETRPEPTPRAAPPRPSPSPRPAPHFETPAWSVPETETEDESEPEPQLEVASSPEAEPLEALAAPAEPPAFEVEVEEPEPPSLAEPELTGVEADEPPLSPEEMVGAADGSPLDSLTDSGESPFDDTLLAAPPMAEEPAPSSWDDVTETCRALAQAGGAMLVDPTGQVFAAKGDWPAPGPDAIAAKLVAMMAKTLKDAPTRSISAPLQGMHLTAWRVPRDEGLITAAFIGPAPIRADTRPAIDAEILNGPAA